MGKTEFYLENPSLLIGMRARAGYAEKEVGTIIRITRVLGRRMVATIKLDKPNSMAYKSSTPDFGIERIAILKGETKSLEKVFVHMAINECFLERNMRLKKKRNPKKNLGE